MNQVEIHLFSLGPMFVGVSSESDLLTDALAEAIASEVFSRIAPRSGRTVIDVSVDDLELGYSFRITGFFPHERRGLKRLGQLDVTAERLCSCQTFSACACVREDPSFAPATPHDPASSAN
jgi:hypothetical protein